MMDLTVAVPIVLALVEVAKRLGMGSKFAPIAAVVLGLGIFAVWGDGVLLDKLFEGLISGLTASGLYSGIKKTVE